MMPASAPFSGSRYVMDAVNAGHRPLELKRTTPEDAENFGRNLAGMEPWARLGTSSEQMARFLATSNETKRCFTILHDGERAGVIIIIFPWLAGPYLNLLAVLPAYQRRAIGRTALSWLEAEAAAAGSRNSFLCVSAFNDAAIAFYRRNGYSEAALLGDLIKDGEDEILMRKRLTCRLVSPRSLRLKTI
jgi:ribosomal protein S18 acetylase RimI-like enzyme